MDVHVLLEKYSPLFRVYALPILLGLLGLVFFIYGLIPYFFPKKDSSAILYEAVSDPEHTGASPAGEAKNSVALKTITVDVEGAVQNPGVYALSGDSRIQDALIAAGGLGGTADREKVAKSLNLAAKLADGAKVYIPSAGEMAIATSVQADMGGSGAEALININSAGESELDSLPGVGKATADKIIGGRPYGSIDELTGKKIVGQKVFEQIKVRIVAE